MKKLYFILTTTVLLLATQLMAQTFHNIDVANFSFTPSQLTINVGDTVVWTNSEGIHNVDGNLIDYPDNPESFGNGVGPAGWTYQFIFTIAGDYNYQCSVHPSMVGSITVIDTSVGILDIENPVAINFYPNPVKNQLSWKWSDIKSAGNANMTIYDVTGKVVDSFSLNVNINRDVSHFAEGLYTFIILQENRPIQFGKILVSR